MNTTTNTELSKVEAAAAPSQLITLEPEKYVAEVYRPFREQLKKEVKEHGKLSFVSGVSGASKHAIDIQTKDGMTVAKAMRSAFKAIRTAAEAARKERKAPILQIGKLLDTAYKDLETEVSEYEDRADKAIKAEEQRIEDEKQRKIAAERARVEAIENRIAQIRNVPLQLSGASSADIVKAIQQHSYLVLDPADFDEYLEDGINAVNATLVELEKVRVRAVEREEAERRAAAERAELERLRAEREQRDREESERREKEAAERRAEDERRRKESEAQAAEMARLRAELEALRKPAVVAEPTVEAREVINSYGSYYDHSTIKQNGDPVMRNADGSRSVFCDVDEGGTDLAVPRKRPTDTEILDVLVKHFEADRETVIDWLRDFANAVR